MKNKLNDLLSGFKASIGKNNQNTAHISTEIGNQQQQIQEIQMISAKNHNELVPQQPSISNNELNHDEMATMNDVIEDGDELSNIDIMMMMTTTVSIHKTNSKETNHFSHDDGDDDDDTNITQYEQPNNTVNNTITSNTLNDDNDEKAKAQDFNSKRNIQLNNNDVTIKEFEFYANVQTRIQQFQSINRLNESLTKKIYKTNNLKPIPKYMKSKYTNNVYYTDHSPTY